MRIKIRDKKLEGGENKGRKQALCSLSGGK